MSGLASRAGLAVGFHLTQAGNEKLACVQAPIPTPCCAALCCGRYILREVAQPCMVAPLPPEQRETDRMRVQVRWLAARAVPRRTQPQLGALGCWAVCALSSSLHLAPPCAAQRFES